MSFHAYLIAAAAFFVGQVVVIGCSQNGRAALEEHGVGKLFAAAVFSTLVWSLVLVFETTAWFWKLGKKKGTTL
jgi:hypothetical protein